MKKKSVWLAASCLVVAALVLISCAPKAPTPTPTPTPAPAPTPAPKPAPAEKEKVGPVVKEPEYGGTLTVLHTHGGTEPQTWDPWDCNWIVDVHTSPYMENLAMGDFEKYGPRGTNQFPFNDMEYIPIQFLRGCVAESWELPDDTTVIYHLRKGVMFPDKPGVMAAREMTADDVAFCFERQIKSPRAPKVWYEAIESTTAKDKYTVVIKLKYYRLNWLLPMGWGYFNKVYPPELVKAGITNWKNATGTGPFILADYVSGASLTFKGNPVYWDKATIGGKEYKLPFIDKLVWPIIVDESTRLAALRTAKCDINEGVSWKYKKSLEETNPELVRRQVLSSGAWCVAGRMDVKPFDDIRIRRALNMAVDRKAIIDAEMGGEAEMLSFPYCKEWGEDVYTPVEKLPQSARELFEYNPEKAKQLMTEAGYPKGFKAEMVISSPAMVDIASMLVDYWKKHLGIEVELKPYEYATYLAIMYGKKHKQIYMMSKGNGTPSVLRVIGYTGEQWNPALFDDRYFNETYDKVEKISNVAEAKKTFKELNVYFIDKAPYVILPTSYYYTYAFPWVKNWYGETNTNCRSVGQIHARIWIDRDLRAKATGRR